MSAQFSRLSVISALLICTIIGLMGCGSSNATPPANVTPLPSVQAVERTSTSIPWGANDMKYTPINLAARGYSEAEYFQSGNANIYDWPDTSKSAVVKTANIPYVTQIIMWYPSDQSKFSGNVIIEVGNATSGYDEPNIWKQVHEQVMKNGDAYIDMVSQSGPLAKLKQYDPVRYASLNWTPPNASASENGLYWDMLSQTAAWVRYGQNFPLKNVKTVIATGSSQSSVYLNTYVNAVLPIAAKGDGKPIFDGILQQNGPNYFAINSSAAAPYSVPERGIVPIIRLASSADFANMMGPSDNPPLSSRRADSDAPGDQYRLYENACATHNQIWMNLYRTGFTNLNKIGVYDSLTMQRDVTNTADGNDFPGWALLNAALVNLENWINKGVAPPKDLPRLNYVKLGTGTGNLAAAEQLEYAQDAYGNPTGGVRNPWCDVPVAQYVPHAYSYYTTTWCTTNPCYSGSSSFTRNWKIPMTQAQLTAKYGNNAAYFSQWMTSMNSMVTQGLMLPDDAETLRKYVWENPPLPH